jgi:hypothetical protein
MPRTRQTLRTRLLNSDPTLLVSDIVHAEIIARLPRRARNSFPGMHIEWLPNRIWGQNFQLGDPVVKLGHRRGDHVATHPEAHGHTIAEAQEYLRLAVEGTLLHELGHAALDGALLNPEGMQSDGRIFTTLKAVAAADKPVSSYAGQCAGGQCLAGDDHLHELFAEAYRWWAADPAWFAGQFPHWNDIVIWVNAQLGRP